MSRSLFRSTTSLLATLVAVGITACGDDGGETCGTDGAADGISVTGPVDIGFTHLTSLPGNDCPEVDPTIVVSVSIENDRDADGRVFTICIPRPDQLLDGPQTLGDSQSTADILIFDINANPDNCTCTTPPCGYSFDRAVVPTGSVTASGVCDDGDNPAGFALDFDTQVTLKKSCEDTVQSMPFTLSGRVAVTQRQP